MGTATGDRLHRVCVRETLRWSRRGVCLGFVAVAALVASGLGAAPAAKPDAGGRSASEAEPLGENVFLWSERRLLQRLGSAKELLEQGRYGEAVRYLGEIAELSEDCFVPPDESEPTYHSLKSEAQRIIGEMPASGRESYELQYGPRARQMLTKALQTADLAAVAEVARQFFHTQAGYQASLLLGLDRWQHGNPRAGAMILRRLRQAGSVADQFEPTLSLALASCWLQADLPDNARSTLMELKRARGDRKARIGGREVALFARGQDPVAWLRDVLGSMPPVGEGVARGWLMYRGSATRNVATEGSAPLLNVRWKVPLTGDPLIEGFLQQQRQRYRDQAVSESPALHPLAVNNTVLMRTLRSLVAVDLTTGKRQWEIPAEDRLEQLLNANGEALFQQAPQIPIGLCQRVWDDNTYGTLSSDGHYVFSVEDLGLGGGMPSSRQTFIRGRRVREADEPKTYNRLTAHDIRTGKLKWHVGGPEDRFALRQAEVFFLGPPLCVSGSLYVLGETKEEIRLMALEAETGELLWSQQLAAVEQSVSRDVIRRLAGASASYADGVLVCPTSASAVVAVETSSRSLLWGYRYARRNDQSDSTNPILMRMGMLNGGEPSDGWSDPTATLVEGRVLIGPVESDQLHCLNLMDGKLLWKKPRNEDLYLACVHAGTVLMIGRQEARALSLASGEPSWQGRTLRFPDGGVPSGRGFLGGDVYYVPLSSAAIVGIDVRKGEIVQVSKSREGNVPGNLVCSQGRVISQNVDGVESYFQMDALREQVDRRLSRRPDDAEAAALRGEILIGEGNRAAAIECLRRSYAMAPELRTRRMLLETLLEGLDEDFATYRGSAAEIERLVEEPWERARYLRLMAGGLQKAEQWAAALEHYGRLIDENEVPYPLERIDRNVQVRRDRWVQNRLKEMRTQIPLEQAGLLESFVAQQWKALGGQSAFDPLQRVADFLGEQPGVHGARELLLHKFKDAGRFLDAELLLMAALHSDEAAQAGAATVDLALVLRSAGLQADAAMLYERLKTRFATVVCKSGQTGLELYEALPEDVVSGQAASGSAWPGGRVEVTKSNSERARSGSYGIFSLPWRGGEADFFRQTRVYCDQNRVLGRDLLGNIRWQLALNEKSSGNQPGFNHSGAAVAACGHLLVVGTEQKIVAVDTLGLGTSGPRVLWSKDLTPPGMLQQIRSRSLRAMNRGRGMDGGNSILGPVCESYVCYQQNRELIAVDPSSGETLWVRSDVPAVSALFGDGQYVLGVPVDKGEALVFDSGDGRPVGKRSLPPPEQWVGTVRRDLLLWRPVEKGYALERFDPWAQRRKWISRTFEPSAKWCQPGQDTFAVLQRDWVFALLAHGDGHTILESKLPAESGLADLFVFLDEQRCLVLISRQPSGPFQQVPTQPLSGTIHRQVPNGLLYGLDLEGRPLWPGPVKISNQHAILDQPSGLPVLIFGCQPYRRKGNQVGQFESALLCIDKRTGRAVAREVFPNSSGFFEVVGNPERKVVELRLQQGTVRLLFTDEPLPPESADPVAAESDASLPAKLLEAIWQGAQGGVPKKRD